MNEKLAVVIPLYNHAHFIRQGIENVLNQTRPVDRIIIVDDGSRDESVKVVKALAETDSRIEIYEQENAGAHAAINRGIALAEGCAFVAILNSDDIYEPERFERLLPELEKYPDIQLVCSNLRLIDDAGEVLGMEQSRAAWFEDAWAQKEEQVHRWLGKANFVGTTSNFLGRREWFLNHPMRDFRYAHDYFHLLEAAFADGIRILDEKLLRYRVHGTNTITTTAEKLTGEMLRVHWEFLREIREQILNNEKIRVKWAEYLGSSFLNRSSFRVDVFLALLSTLGSEVEWSAELLGGEDVTQRFPELAEFPNANMVHMGRDWNRVRKELKEAKAQLEGVKQENRTQSLLMKSRWASLGRLLGLGRRGAGDGWVNLGAKLGSGRCREILRAEEKK